MQDQNQPQDAHMNMPPNYGPPPKTWLAESIIVTFLCCQIFGIIAIIYSSQVESKHRMGDIQGALDSSRKAKNWVIAAASTGLALVVILFLTGILAAIADGSF